MKFSIKDFFSKCDQIRIFLWIWSHLLKKSLMDNFNFVPFLLVNICARSPLDLWLTKIYTTMFPYYY